LGVFRANRNAADNSVSGVTLVKLIQSPENARTPVSGEKPFRNPNTYNSSNPFFSFTSLGRYWFVDVWAKYNPPDVKRHIGLFNVETHDYLDLQNNTALISKINTGRGVIDTNAGRSDSPLMTDLGLFLF
jgi:hypothetical protein